MLNLKQFGASKKCLAFIEKRLDSDDYRGGISSQHNRFTFEEVRIILRSLVDHSDGNLPMQIRTEDLSKRPHNLPHEQIFAKFCDDVTAKLQKGSQDAMRKNYFPDFQRAGWIERFDPNGKVTDPWSQSRVSAVRVSADGEKLIKNSGTAVERYFLFSKGISKLLGNYIDLTLDFLRDPDGNYTYIDKYEFTLFLTAINSGGSFNIDRDEAKALIKEWREIPRTQRNGIIDYLSTELKPEKFGSDKTSKRDWHNWLNKTEQAFHLMDQTIYFEQRKDPVSHANRLYYMKADVEGENIGNKRLDRSLSQKHKYFANHSVVKASGFELHHVVALAWAESQQHFKILDNWKNMIYIDAFSHAKITQNRNRNIVMSHQEDEISLSTISGDSVVLRLGANVILNPELVTKMLDYNAELLAS